MPVISQAVIFEEKDLKELNTEKFLTISGRGGGGRSPDDQTHSFQSETS